MIDNYFDGFYSVVSTIIVLTVIDLSGSLFIGFFFHLSQKLNIEFLKASFDV